MRQGGMVMKFKISQEHSRQIAVGLYRQVEDFIDTAKRETPEDYESFRSEYLTKQAEQATTPSKHRQYRKNNVLSQ